MTAARPGALLAEIDAMGAALDRLLESHHGVTRGDDGYWPMACGIARARVFSLADLVLKAQQALRDGDLATARFCIDEAARLDPRRKKEAA